MPQGGLPKTAYTWSYRRKGYLFHASGIKKPRVGLSQVQVYERVGQSVI